MYGCIDISFYNIVNIVVNDFSAANGIVWRTKTSTTRGGAVNPGNDFTGVIAKIQSIKTPVCY